jgi:hypothetical protein
MCECIHCLYYELCTPAERLELLNGRLCQDDLDLEFELSDESDEFIWAEMSYRKFVYTSLDYFENEENSLDLEE